jgi:signal transduction histidine kinase
LVEEIQLSINEKHKINFVYSGHCNNACMDEKLLLHILINLLTNAIKYSPKNTTVHFRCYCEDGEVTFKIKDEGIGIPTKTSSDYLSHSIEPKMWAISLVLA